MYRKLILLLGIVIVLSSFVSADLTSSLVSYYTFDSNADDDVGSNDGSVTGATWADSGYGIITGGYDFDGTNDKITISDDNTLDFTTTYSSSVWVKASGTNNYQTIYSKYVWGSDSGIGLLWYDHDSFNQLRVMIPDTATTYKYGGVVNDIEDGNWHHIVVIYNGGGAVNADKVKLYVDNSLQTLSFSGTIPSTIRVGAGDMLIGDLSGLSYRFDGYIDELSFWSRAITSSEVTSLYNSGSGFQYPFSDGDDCDYSGSGDWIIDEDCHIDTSASLETGKTLFVTAGHTVIIDSGVVVN